MPRLSSLAQFLTSLPVEKTLLFNDRSNPFSPGQSWIDTFPIAETTRKFISRSSATDIDLATQLCLSPSAPLEKRTYLIPIAGDEPIPRPLLGQWIDTTIDARQIVILDRDAGNLFLRFSDAIAYVPANRSQIYPLTANDPDQPDDLASLAVLIGDAALPGADRQETDPTEKQPAPSTVQDAKFDSRSMTTLCRRVAITSQAIPSDPITNSRATLFIVDAATFKSPANGFYASWGNRMWTGLYDFSPHMPMDDRDRILFRHIINHFAPTNHTWAPIPNGPRRRFSGWEQIPEQYVTKIPTLLPAFRKKIAARQLRAWFEKTDAHPDITTRI